MTFEIIKGDLFDPNQMYRFDALAQGVNTKGIMGAGIAVQFRDRWPHMYSQYVDLCMNYTDILPGLLHTYVPPMELGESTEHEDGHMSIDIVQDGPIIFNLFSQDYPGRNGSLAYLASSTLLMRLEAESLDLQRVGLPWIGCGIAGLAKHNVQHYFERILEPSTVEFILVEQ